MRAQATRLDAIAQYFTPDYMAEEKIDGARAMLIIGTRGSVFTNDRSAGNRSASFPDLATITLPELAGTILDGEFRAPPLPGEAQAAFGASVGWFNSSPGTARMTRMAYGKPPEFHAFDVLAVAGVPVTGKSYDERRLLLEEVTAQVLAQYPGCGLRLVPQYPATAETLAAVLERGGEGIILKRRDGRYQPGKRSDSWLKFKAVATIDAFLTGNFRAGEGGRAGAVGSVEIAVCNPDGTVRPLGFVAVKPSMIATYTNAVTHGLRSEMTGVIWEVAANGYYSDGGTLRHPRFLRVRADKTAADCGTQQLAALLKI
jgi:bifunctional non-homologous end joining protein LigD